ncbi:MAG: hypothetical protein OET90_05915, partial [Desulfuromonadales bacterium]|nr:hypothetical protein [Desulfuromonadales bacterium]
MQRIFPTAIALTFVALFLCSCVGGVKKDVVWADPTLAKSWPEPPARERIRLLRTMRGASDFREEDTEQKAWRWLLGEDETDIPLVTPLAVASDDDGVVWVADSGSSLVYKIDVSREKVDYIQEADGVRLTLPAGVAIDAQRGRVYVSDAVLGQVFVFDPQTLAFIRQLELPEEFGRPAGMAISEEGTLFVVDVLGGSVAVFDSNYRYQRQIFSLKGEGARFDRPIDVALGPNGEVVVLSASSFRLEIQSADGELIGTIGQVG